MPALPSRVRIVEVGPRDGLQNEPQPIPTAEKVRFIERLAGTGLADIEVTSFVHPYAVPQLADAADVVRALPHVEGVRYSALVPNMRGLERAVEAGVQRIAVFTGASETFTRRNINMTIDESFAVFEPLVEQALDAGLTVRGYLSTCFVCPYEGEIDRGIVRTLAERLLELGVDEVAISDTIGAAVPADVETTVGHVLETVPVERLALHMHDTYGTALANVYAALGMGVRAFDTAAGGLGGCPYAPGAAGNLATEDLVYFLDRLGIAAGVDLAGVFEASRGIARVLGHALPSKQYQRLAAQCGAADDAA